MTKARFAALITTAIAFTSTPQYGYARPDSTRVFTIAQNEAALPVQGVDPIITGGRGPTVADAGWSERSQTRHRCSFCTGYQPFPQD